ncbi:MAG TPA: signal peptidase II [Rhizomicrobium sp.]|nr:signal peptidase II [Rhizomicrobium sp.]
MSKTLPREWGLVSAAVALVADQGSKFALLYGFGFLHMVPGRSIPLLPFFNLVMVWNPGISYGLFPASSVWGTALLVLVSLAAVAGLGYWLWGMTSLSLGIGVGLVIGGALGNLIDRLVYGRVADFFHLHGFGYDFYVFNVADIAITFGAVAIIYEVLKPQGDSAEG